MKYSMLFAAVLAAWSTAVLAADPPATTQAQAFQSGKEFSNGAAGNAAAAGTLNTTSGTLNVPKYNTNPPEQSIFGGGLNLIGSAGTSKVAGCEGYQASDAYNQQECNAVNYLQKMPAERTKFNIDKNTDPIMVGSKDVIANPGTIPASGTSVCHIETTTIPGTFKTETCEESTKLTKLSCSKNLLPQCAYVGSPITWHQETKSGAITNVVLVPTPTPGLYNYSVSLPLSCRSTGLGNVAFDLTTIGFGSYITINLSELDDTAAVAVNKTTVFAGYPNNGPQYSSGFFPTTETGFATGYSWTENVGTATAPQIRTMVADTKLLDYCPAPYYPRTQKSFTSNPSSDTYRQAWGFFCNPEGKFLMNRHEGDGNWAGSVSASMPLKVGRNDLTVFWGTGPGSNDCGQVKVTGQIYNVAPSCATQWDDQCAPMRGGL